MFLRFFFNLFGWKVVGQIPADLKKAVIAVAPHNTWKDFILGISARSMMKRKIGYLGKAELFKPPFGFIFKWLGGTPVQRFANNNMVENHKTLINASEELIFGVAPEGTRKNVEKLRTGFYYIANAAQIPIIPVGFDYILKIVVVSEPFFTSGDFEKDMKTYFVPFFNTINGTNKNWLRNYENGIF